MQLARHFSTIAALVAAFGFAVSAAEAGPSIPGYTVSGDTVLIGQIADQSGPNAPVGQTKWGLQAYFAAMNDADGVNGRKLKLVSYDDSYQPSQTVVLARKLVFEDQVLALASDVGSPTTAAIYKTMNAWGVSLIGPTSGSPIFSTPTQPYIFPVWPLYTLDGKTMANYAKTHFPGQKVGVIYQADAYGKPILAGIVSVLGEPAVSLGYEATQTDFSSDIIKLKSEGVQVVLLATLATTGARIMHQMAAINYAPTTMMTASACGYEGIFKTIPNLEGTYCTAFVPPMSGDDPQYKAFAAAMAKYEPGHDADVYAAWGWLAGQVVVGALKDAKEPLTRDSFNAALNGLTDLPTLAGPLTYTAEDHKGLRHEFLWIAKDGAWTKMPGSDYPPAS